jgi:hypothetical protein
MQTRGRRPGLHACFYSIVVDSNAQTDSVVMVMVTLDDHDVMVVVMMSPNNDMMMVVMMVMVLGNSDTRLPRLSGSRRVVGHQEGNGVRDRCKQVAVRLRAENFTGVWRGRRLS